MKSRIVDVKPSIDNKELFKDYRKYESVKNLHKGSHLNLDESILNKTKFSEIQKFDDKSKSGE